MCKTGWFLTGLVLTGLVSCSPSGHEKEGTQDEQEVEKVTCVADYISCRGDVARTCNLTGDGWAQTEECTGATPTCVPRTGCRPCRPAAGKCEGQVAMQCTADGMNWEVLETCTADTSCFLGSCRSPCADAAASNSYEGCEYWAATLMNSQVSSDFIPAVVISNRNEEDAFVTVERGGHQLAAISVPPNGTETVSLPWVEALKQHGANGEDFDSANVAQGAYRVSSSLPVTVYQFNPLEYRLDRECKGGDSNPLDGQCFSFTNDASLLLPVHVLTKNYMVLTRPSLGIKTTVEGFLGGLGNATYSVSPSVLAVINPQAEPVDVEILFSAPTQGGAGVGRYRAGDRGTFTIQPGGVLQIASEIAKTCEPDWSEPQGQPCGDGLSTCTYGYCAMTDYDLTGTEITASAPVAVFGAHNCDFVPFNRWACDHLEEQLYPFEANGTTFVVNQTHREQGEPDVWRILSGADGNHIRFTPASVHQALRLDRGDHVEFEAKGAFMIEADGPIMVGQFAVGQSYSGIAGSDLPPGDPSFALAVPVEQYRSSYNFLAPTTYDKSYVNITTDEAGTHTIELDGRPLNASWAPVQGTPYFTVRQPIPAGSHSLSSSSGDTFGIMVYGYGQYTSYMYPGGLDLKQISLW